VACAFSGILNVAETKEPAIFNLGGETTAPPHLFGQMAKTREGLELLVPHIPALLHPLQSPESDVGSVRACFLALGHFASSAFAEEIVERYKIPEVMMACVDDSDSYVLSGTLISALSLFKQSRYVASVLREHKWQLFRIGSHHVVIPTDPRAWLGEPRRVPVTPAVVQDIPRFDHVISLLKMMSNSLGTHKASESLRQLKAAGDPAIAEPELARYAHTFIASFCLLPGPRKTVCELFAGTPLVAWDATALDRDTAGSAEASARVHMAVHGVGEARSGPLPTLSAEAIRDVRPVPRCPEAFLSELDFDALAGCSREEFYARPSDYQLEVRARLADGYISGTADQVPVQST